MMTTGFLDFFNLVSETVVRDKAHNLVGKTYINLIPIEYRQNWISCLNHPTICLQWGLGGETYYQLISTTNRQFSSYYIKDFNGVRSLQNYQINRVGMSKFYLTPYSFIFDSLSNLELASIIEKSTHHKGVFNLMEYNNNSPTAAITHITNSRINTTHYMNTIINNTIVQTKIITRHT
jgi:hypothetical protein